MKLDKEEKDILKSYENDEWESVENLQEKKDEYKAYAKNTTLRGKNINIRLSEKDFFSIKKKSIAEGIPYQALISNILHKYINGKYKEI